MAGSRTSDGEQGAGAGQVVQLRREWFGPVAELIPFGPAAETRAEEAPVAAVSAADFWGGDADLLQEVVERADGGWDAAEALAVTVGAEPLVPEVVSDEPVVRRARERVVRYPIALGLVAVAVVLVVWLVAAGAMSGGVLRRPAVTSSLVSRASDHHARVHRAGVVRKRRRVVASPVVHAPTHVAASQTAPAVVSYSAPPPP